MEIYAVHKQSSCFDEYPMTINRLTGTCVHMFSGGRDSSLAALRLSQIYEKLILVTVTVPDLRGIAAVRERLDELSSYLDGKSEWLNVALPNSLETQNLNSRRLSCLTCHHAYIVSGICIAESHGVRDLSVGYTEYQSDWTEQTPYAIDSLKKELLSIGLNLILPVIDIDSKDSAICELQSYGLSADSKEQKCLRQMIDPKLRGDTLTKEVDDMTHDLVKNISNRQNLSINILDRIIF
jgi:hypothetical protein